MKKFSLLLALLIINTIYIFTEPLTLQNTGKAPHIDGRPSVALVLSGGGARGYAHIPIIKMIEEIGIPVDIVIGTSIGSIVGGLYSAGYTPDEIATSFKGIEWSSIFNDTDFSPYESILKNNSLLTMPISFNLGLDFSMKMGSGLSSGQRVYELLKLFTTKIPSYIDFDNLYIPFRAVSCDMGNGSEAIFHDGDIAEAIRSSMSLPGVFNMFEIDGHYYMDGGLRYNIPANVAKEMGYDIIISIDVTPKIPKSPDEYNSNPTVAFMQINPASLIQIDRECMELSTLGLTPDLSDFSILDFNRLDDIYSAGKNCAEQNRDKLEAVRRMIFPADYTSDGTRISSLQQLEAKGFYDNLSDLTVDYIYMDGVIDNDINYINKVFNTIKSKPLTTKSLENLFSSINNTGNYSNVIYRPDQDDKKLNIILHQNAQKRSLIGFSLDYMQTSSFSSMSKFTVSPSLQFRGLTGIGSVLSLRLTGVNDFGTELFWHMPFNPNLFLQFDITYYTSNYGVQESGPSSLSTMQTFTTLKTELSTGIKVGNSILVTVGAFYKYVNIDQSMVIYDPIFNDYCSDVGISILNDKNIDTMVTGIFGNINLSTLDYKVFPSKGILLNNSLRGFINPLDTHPLLTPVLVNTTEVRVIHKLTKNISFDISGFAGIDVTTNLLKNPVAIIEEGYSLCDRIYFPQIAAPANYGIYKAAVKLALQFKPFEELTILGGDLLLRGEFSIGNVAYNYNNLVDIVINDDKEKSTNLIWSTGLGAGIRIKELCCMYLRIGCGSTRADNISPFLAIDFGSIRF